jgi:hypothetical protein
MICERCDGKGIVLSQETPRWSPESWDGEERRKGPREESDAKFKEVPAPFYTTCEACGGLGQILPGLLSPNR